MHDFVVGMAVGLILGFTLGMFVGAYYMAYRFGKSIIGYIYKEDGE